jgi:predicted PolB exonuclease-like 3'-5' exonuclease
MQSNLLKNILFLDLETVSQHSDFKQLDERFKSLWEKKSSVLKRDGDPESMYQERAAIYAEFGKIVCIGTGYFTEEAGELVFRTRAIAGSDEKEILEEFSAMLRKLKAGKWKLCAHNGKEFDFPYLCRRLLVNGLPLPESLRIMGKKPWETQHLIDTMEMWKFGDIKAYTSLDLMAACLDVPGSKDDINGAQVGRVFHESGDLERIARYCRKDVATMALVYMCLNGLPILKPEQVIHQLE